MSEDRYVTSQTLLMRAKNPDDHQAWNDFVDFYKRFIYHILHKMSINFNDFDDLVQVVLLRLWESLKNYEKQDCKFRSWLSQVTRNTVLNYLDKQQRQNKRQEQMGELQDMQLKLNSYGDGELERMIENEWRAYVSTMALENIKKLFSGVAVEAFLMSQKEVPGDKIGEELGIKKESAYVLISRVKSKFVAEMKRLIHEMEI
ncbi:probable RNA polymerase sigma-H factor [Lentisphaera araneosa HTCC2155]|uniref:Probable RNA polymerase sigma-H factor n=1 Tax=Lentisphaera araneosa HTCC2155 TaxID=313628 RepID=A6DNA8_9BACT|nr:sigma-70 family RNA polymerase sigma factor [Lentisphaera araneosa]EDM26856.1 probable RNA polymerase sigma-H factor [Lentisphaera araneosa HTCC2155]